MSIVLIGFKNVGKSSIGVALAQRIQGSFLDLDEAIEMRYAAKQDKKSNCREIAEMHGENYFRELEKYTLSETLQEKPTVLSVGGGTVMDGDSRALLKNHTVIHIIAPYEVVYRRIMANGLPSFFPAGESPRVSFHLLWKEREAVYKEIAAFCVYNHNTIAEAVEDIVNHEQIRELL